MANRIQSVIRGKAPTLLEADKANELIDAINAFLSLKVAPNGAGKLEVTGIGTGRPSAILHLEPPEDEEEDTAAELSVFPFSLAAAGSSQISVTPGTVNGITPTIGGTPIDAATPPTLPVSLGTTLVYLRATIGVDPLEEEFGHLLSAEIVASASPIESTFENPVLRLGRVVVSESGVTIQGEVFGSLQLMRFYADYLWSPTFAVPAG